MARRQGDKAVRATTGLLMRARGASDDLVASRINFLVYGGGVDLDERVSDLPGSEGLRHLLASHIAAMNKASELVRDPRTARLTDRQLVDAALLVFAGVVEEAARRVEETGRDGDEA